MKQRKSEFRSKQQKSIPILYSSCKANIVHPTVVIATCPLRALLTAIEQNLPAYQAVTCIIPKTTSGASILGLKLQRILFVTRKRKSISKVAIADLVLVLNLAPTLL